MYWFLLWGASALRVLAAEACFESLPCWCQSQRECLHCCERVDMLDCPACFRNALDPPPISLNLMSSVDAMPGRNSWKCSSGPIVPTSLHCTIFLHCNCCGDCPASTPSCRAIASPALPLLGLLRLQSNFPLQNSRAHKLIRLHWLYYKIWVLDTYAVSTSLVLSGIYLQDWDKNQPLDVHKFWFWPASLLFEMK